MVEGVVDTGVAGDLSFTRPELAGHVALVGESAGNGAVLLGPELLDDVYELVETGIEVLEFVPEGHIFLVLGGVSLVKAQFGVGEHPLEVLQLVLGLVLGQDGFSIVGAKDRH